MRAEITKQLAPTPLARRLPALSFALYERRSLTPSAEIAPVLFLALGFGTPICHSHRDLTLPPPPKGIFCTPPPSSCGVIVPHPVRARGIKNTFAPAFVPAINPTRFHHRPTRVGRTLWFLPAIYPTGSHLTPGSSSQNQGMAACRDTWETSFPPITGDQKARDGEQGRE